MEKLLFFEISAVIIVAISCINSFILIAKAAKNIGKTLAFFIFGLSILLGLGAIGYSYYFESIDASLIPVGLFVIGLSSTIVHMVYLSTGWKMAIFMSVIFLFMGTIQAFYLYCFIMLLAIMCFNLKKKEAV